MLALLSALDANKDRELDRDEFLGGFGKWFAAWASGQGDALAEDKVREGLSAAVPLRFGPPPAEVLERFTFVLHTARRRLVELRLSEASMAFACASGL